MTQCFSWLHYFILNYIHSYCAIFTIDFLVCNHDSSNFSIVRKIKLYLIIWSFMCNNFYIHFYVIYLFILISSQNVLVSLNPLGSRHEIHTCWFYCLFLTHRYMDWSQAFLSLSSFVICPEDALSDSLRAHCPSLPSLFFFLSVSLTVSEET